MHVVIGILTNEKGEILIAQRPQHVLGGGLWEFPGGKVELNESSFNALQREFNEEIGIQVVAADPWFQVEHDYPQRRILLDSWTIRDYQGIPIGAENQPIQWVDPNELVKFNFPEGNLPFLKALCSHLYP